MKRISGKAFAAGPMSRGQFGLARALGNPPPQTLVSANNLRAAATHDAIEKWKADLVVVEEPASFGSSGGRRAIHRIDLPGRRFERLHVIRHPIDFFRVEVRMNDGVAEQPAGAGIVIDDIAYRRYLSVLENILPGLSRGRREQRDRGLARAENERRPHRG